MSPNELLEIIKPVDLKPLTTYCGELARSIPADSEHFKREELHYTLNGMRAVYACSLDGRQYEVLIKALGR